MALAGSLLSDLSPADAAQVRKGGQVMITQDVDGKPWPRVQIYQTVKAKPEELMAVFFDYDNAVRFVPNCTKSKVSRLVNPLIHDVDYEVAVPVFADEVYTARNTLSRKAGRYQVDWRVLRATSIKSSEGSFAVEAHGDGSILRYTNLVEPSSQAAGLLRGIALGQMRDTVTALTTQVEKQRSSEASELSVRVDRLEQALTAE